MSKAKSTLLNDAVKLNGNFLEDMIDGYYTIGSSGRKALGKSLTTFSVGSADGETIKGSRYPSRTITIYYAITRSNEDDLIMAVNQLNNLLNQEEVDFIFNDEPDKFYTGTAIMDSEPKKYRNAVKGSFKILCPYPFKRSVTKTVLSSTDLSGVVIDDDARTATFTFNYKGTVPARPVLKASFASAKSGGDYSDDGDCGFVAFMDGEENIVQLGNPEAVDIDQYENKKNGILANSEFTDLTAWTPTNVAVAQISDTYWNSGAGQTQKYAKPTGTASLVRTTGGAVNHEFDIVHRMCVSQAAQTGKFEALLKNNNKVIVGFRIEKTGNGTSGIVSYILNDKVVGTDTIDLSYYNTHFGYCRRDPVYVTQYYSVHEYYYVKKKKKKKKKKWHWVTYPRVVQSGWSYTQSNLNSGWTKDADVITFSVGNLPDRTFKCSDITYTPSIGIEFNFDGDIDTNCVHSCSFLSKAGVPFAEIPNVFTAGDVVEGDCNSADVTLYRAGSAEGHLEPQYGALGNDWENFEIKPGQNIIQAAWSNWVGASYKPLIQIIFNEVYL